MYFERQRQSKKGEAAKQVGRGTVAPIRRTAVDSPLNIFETAFDILSRGVIIDPTVLRNLKTNRDRIPYASDRSNQRYLAAALIGWYLLGSLRPAELTSMDEDEYHRIVAPLLEGLSDLPGATKMVAVPLKSKASKKSTEEGAENVVEASMKPELTLFRYIVMVAVELNNPLE